MCEAFDYMSQQRPLEVLLVGWHHSHSFDVVSALVCMCGYVSWERG